MKFAVVVFPGSNSDYDAFYAASKVVGEQAYEMVQRNAMKSFHDKTDFKPLLLADADIVKVLPKEEIEKAFDLKEQLRNVDAVFKRVFYVGA